MPSNGCFSVSLILALKLYATIYFAHFSHEYNIRRYAENTLYDRALCVPRSCEIKIREGRNITKGAYWEFVVSEKLG
jgi:hypothetical protein